MAKFIKMPVSVEGVLLIEPTVFGDKRGFFMETYNKQEFYELGIDTDFVQDNHSRSKRGTLRGLHFQTNRPQAKLVRVTSGEVFDVAIDLRCDSATFGKWFGCILTEKNKRMIFIPEGFAHGFLVLSESADFLYKCSDFYYPEHEAGIIWNDPDIAIDWPFEKYGITEPLLSEKDGKLPRLGGTKVHFFKR